MHKAGHSYLWSTGSTDTSLVSNGTKAYSLKVTSVHGCASYDTVYLTFVYPDLQITDLNEPFDLCGTTNSESMIITLHNPGTDTIGTADSIGFTILLKREPKKPKKAN
ncbi:MAG: hypothetical protein HC896_13580 [Bacteroidales bacterium]|nr:hypothetical protein [Bacteroidales bacterium]